MTNHSEYSESILVNVHGEFNLNWFCLILWLLHESICNFFRSLVSFMYNFFLSSSYFFFSSSTSLYIIWALIFVTLFASM